MKLRPDCRLTACWMSFPLQVGPMAFDIGCLLGNMFLSLLVHQAQSPSSALKNAKASSSLGVEDSGEGGGSDRADGIWLLAAIREYWEHLSTRISDHSPPTGAAIMTFGSSSRSPQQQQQQDPSLPLVEMASGRVDLDGLWRDSLGFAAICMIRLTVGRLHFPPLEALPSSEARADCSARILRLARELMSMDSCPRSMPELLTLLHANVR